VKKNVPNFAVDRSKWGKSNIGALVIFRERPQAEFKLYQARAINA